MSFEWNKQLLADVADIIMGQSPPSASYNQEKRGLPFFQGKADFGDFYPSIRFYCDAPSKIAEKGDILISVRAPVGPTNISETKSCIGRGLAAIRPGRKINIWYLLYFIRYIEPELAKSGKGSTFDAISRDDLENIQLPLPPLPEQQRIAAILQKADRLRQLRRYARRLSDGYLQSVFLEMFGEITQNSNEWELEKIGNLVNINPPITKELPLDMDISFIPMSAVDEISAKIVYFEKKKVREVLKGYTPFIERDVLFAKITPCMENGKSAIAHGLLNEIGFGSTEFHVLRPNEKLLPEYILWLVRREEFRKIAAKSFTGTAGQQRVPVTFLEEFVVATPPLELQKLFANICNNHNILRKKISESSRQAEHLFQSLLARAFEGAL